MPVIPGSALMRLFIVSGIVRASVQLRDVSDIVVATCQSGSTGCCSAMLEISPHGLAFETDLGTLMCGACSNRRTDARA